LIFTENLELREVNYKDDENVFNDAILNEDQADNIESINFQKQLNIPQNCTNFEERVKMALYNVMSYYWQVPSDEGILAALLDPRLKYQTNTLPIKQPLPSTSKLLASMYRSSNAQMDEISDYIGMPEISYDQSILATSTPSERLFSDAGNIMSVKRTNLLPITFEHLIFLKRNHHSVDSIFPNMKNKE
ncbi:25253_t:CDS:2, partial [Racocetra persica]